MTNKNKELAELIKLLKKNNVIDFNDGAGFSIKFDKPEAHGTLLDASTNDMQSTNQQDDESSSQDVQEHSVFNQFVEPFDIRNPAHLDIMFGNEDELI